MDIGSIVTNALRTVSCHAGDVSRSISLRCKRNGSVVRGTVLAYVLNSSANELMPSKTDGASVPAKGKNLVFMRGTDDGWCFDFDPFVGDVFIVDGKEYSATSVTFKYGRYYRVEVVPCRA